MALEPMHGYREMAGDIMPAQRIANYFRLNGGGWEIKLMYHLTDSCSSSLLFTIFCNTVRLESPKAWLVVDFVGTSKTTVATTTSTMT